MNLPRGVAGLRPTAARVRGAIYDRLGGFVEGARVLDLFAGSGALSFEALSRGATWATLVETDPRVARHLRAQAQVLGVANSVEIVRADALQFLSRGARAGVSPRPYDLVLVDPPFSTPKVFEPVAGALMQGWLAPGAWVVCERELVRGKSLPVAWPRGLDLRLARTYGQAIVEFLQVADRQAASLCEEEST